MTAKKPHPRPRLVFQKRDASYSPFVVMYEVFDTGADQHIGYVGRDGEGWWRTVNRGVEVGIRQRTRREAAEWLR